MQEEAESQRRARPHCLPLLPPECPSLHRKRLCKCVGVCTYRNLPVTCFGNKVSADAASVRGPVGATLDSASSWGKVQAQATGGWRRSWNDTSGSTAGRSPSGCREAGDMCPLGAKRELAPGAVPRDSTCPERGAPHSLSVVGLPSETNVDSGSGVPRAVACPVGAPAASSSPPVTDWGPAQAASWLPDHGQSRRPVSLPPLWPHTEGPGAPVPQPGDRMAEAEPGRQRAEQDDLQGWSGTCPPPSAPELPPCIQFSCRRQQASPKKQSHWCREERRPEGTAEEALGHTGPSRSRLSAGVLGSWCQTGAPSSAVHPPPALFERLRWVRLSAARPRCQPHLRRPSPTHPE
ncbi:translation initiation factor IF-2-like [Artibeus jamaicensis]|uniref:translation initiation factor IF-2-like n=1 Tax=Artibeus jamaicensis TaxID=9417 RepID=UPI00235A5D5E|nr:translation initiation factor IF-2-like [Artibeus jamaicensis]